MPDEDLIVAGRVAVDILQDIEEATWGHSAKSVDDQIESAVLRLRVAAAAYAISQQLLSELAPHTRKMVEELGKNIAVRILKQYPEGTPV